MTPLFIQASAEEDILRQVEWYAEQGAIDAARRFHQAVDSALRLLIGMPNAGTPRETSNPQLAGLRTWPVKGFDEFQIYYLSQAERVTILRMLHSKRDIGTILENQVIEPPKPH